MSKGRKVGEGGVPSRMGQQAGTLRTITMYYFSITTLYYYYYYFYVLLLLLPTAIILLLYYYAPGRLDVRTDHVVFLRERLSMRGASARDCIGYGKELGSTPERPGRSCWTRAAARWPSQRPGPEAEIIIHISISSDNDNNESTYNNIDNDNNNNHVNNSNNRSRAGCNRAPLLPDRTARGAPRPAPRLPPHL